MKRFLIVIVSLLFICGCVRLDNASLDDLITETLSSKYKLYNHINSGYKYYLPRTLSSSVKDEYNEIIKSKYYDYYLYVDLVAYNKKVSSLYEEDPTIYYSKLLENDGKSGLINVKKIGDEDLVNIIYNYGKIEVKCEHKDLNEVVTNSLVILSSITYVDDVINKLLSESEFSSADEQVNIFPEVEVDNNTLDDIDEAYNGNEEEDYDPNVIKERRWVYGLSR